MNLDQNNLKRMNTLFKDSNIDQLRQSELRILKFSFEGLQKDMSPETFTDVLKYVNEELELPITPKALEVILATNGYAYANLIEYGASDTETRSSVSNAIAQHYLNQAWPRYKDEGSFMAFQIKLIDKIAEDKI